MTGTTPTAHLIHGFAGAGKTTLARRLEREHGAARFTHDERMHRLYGSNPPRDRFAELYRRVDDLIWNEATAALRSGKDVILDNGFWTRASRDEARARVADAGARAVLYNVTCPEEVMRDRVARRSEAVPEDSLWINDAAFDLFKTRFEPLADDEERVDVDGAAGRE